MLYIVTRPDGISLDVTPTNTTFLLNISLGNYIEDGVYSITTTVTWVRFLHLCANSDGMRHTPVVTERPFNMSSIKQSITGLLSNSEYSITVMITNVVDSETAKSDYKTTEAGNSL